VQRLNLINGDWADSLQRKWLQSNGTAERIARYIPLLPSLQLGVLDFNEALTAAVLLEGFPQLTSVTFKYVNFASFAQFADFAAGHPCLETVKLFAVEFGPQGSENKPSLTVLQQNKKRFPPLKHLLLSSCAATILAGFLSITMDGRAPVASLTLKSIENDEFIASTLVQLGPTLKKLGIPELSSSFTEGVPRTHINLGANTALQHLRFSNIKLSTHWQAHDLCHHAWITEMILQLKSIQLEEIHFDIFLGIPEDLDSLDLQPAVRYLTPLAFPRLRRIHFQVWGIVDKPLVANYIALMYTDWSSRGILSVDPPF
jgi:hypothetical protein